MKYSIRGSSELHYEDSIVQIINQYPLWRLITKQSKHILTGLVSFTYEAWLNTEADKDRLFNEIKLFVEQSKGTVSWHECSHDELSSSPCVIAEEYTKS